MTTVHPPFAVRAALAAGERSDLAHPLLHRGLRDTKHYIPAVALPELHHGPTMGVPATGASVQFRARSVDRIADDSIEFHSRRPARVARLAPSTALPALANA